MQAQQSLHAWCQVTFAKVLQTTTNQHRLGRLAGEHQYAECVVK